MYQLTFSAFWPKTKRKGLNSKRCIVYNQAEDVTNLYLQSEEDKLYWQTDLLSKGLQHAERIAINGKGENSLKKCFNRRVLATAPASFQHLPEQKRVHG